MQFHNINRVEKLIGNKPATKNLKADGTAPTCINCGKELSSRRCKFCENCNEIMSNRIICDRCPICNKEVFRNRKRSRTCSRCRRLKLTQKRLNNEQFSAQNTWNNVYIPNFQEFNPYVFPVYNYQSGYNKVDYQYYMMHTMQPQYFVNDYASQTYSSYDTSYSTTTTVTPTASNNNNTDWLKDWNINDRNYVPQNY